VERLSEHANVSKRTFYQHFSGRMSSSRTTCAASTEQAIDTTDASPCSRALAALDRTPGGHFRSRHFTTPLLRQGEM
jgi:AcrR family transcriptional regulator